MWSPTWAPRSRACTTNGTTEFKARFPGERTFSWYRSYLKSIADESGKVYRLVGRADKLRDENRWMRDQEAE